jgi:2-polyprenyl-3-methyl-5-hydroxy-6-metoxy-1,4-benzoquinol methylase
MYIVNRSLKFIRGGLLVYSPSVFKKLFWDKEYSEGKWDFIDNTAGDCVYSYLEKYARRGSILDLGCGPGNTANELPATAYQSYLGVDISDSCLDKARRRTEEAGRAEKNSFAQGDFLSFVPPERFDVILLRESLYHVPMAKIPGTLDRYSQHLKKDGVFVVRLYIVNKGKILSRPRAMIDLVKRNFPVIEYREHPAKPGTTPIILVFGARSPRGVEGK